MIDGDYVVDQAIADLADTKRSLYIARATIKQQDERIEELEELVKHCEENHQDDTKVTKLKTEGDSG